MERKVDWRSWRQYFETRTVRQTPPLDVSEDYAQLPESLARSLAIFQLGESGGGSIVNQAASSRLSAVNQDYAEAVRLFVAEEHRHAHLLALCVRMLNGRLKRKNWTARLFVIVRRLFGLRTKVLVLLAAEVVGLSYYNLITSRLPDGRMRTFLQEIADDERAHLRFHCAFLYTQCAGMLQRLVFRAAWRSGMAVAAVIVLLDHRAVVRDLNIPTTTLWRAWRGYARLAERLVLQGVDQHRETGSATHRASSGAIAAGVALKEACGTRRA